MPGIIYWNLSNTYVYHGIIGTLKGPGGCNHFIQVFNSTAQGVHKADLSRRCRITLEEIIGIERSSQALTACKEGRIDLNLTNTFPVWQHHCLNSGSRLWWAVG